MEKKDMDWKEKPSFSLCFFKHLVWVPSYLKRKVLKNGKFEGCEIDAFAVFYSMCSGSSCCRPCLR